MLISMTGFGKAEKVNGIRKIVVEVRSLNSKQFDFNLRLPSIYRDFEMDIRNRVSGLLQRGKIDMSVSIEEVGEAQVTPINEPVFSAYYKQIQAIAQNNGIRLNPSEIVPAILRLPDVLKVQKDEIASYELNTVLLACDEALRNLAEFRAKEGAILEADMVKRVALILNYLDQLEPFETQRIQDVKQRLTDGLRQLTSDVKVDANRFEQEVIYYLEKLDITEEKVRLRQHCTYFTETINEKEPVGRKLGFIAQEMGREINTLGSKANNAHIQKLVVLMKDELEKIKEQLLNIL